MMKQFSKVLTFCCIITILLIFPTCANPYDDVVPWVEVRVRVNTLSAEHIDLQSISGRAIVKNVGYGGNGIIIYRASESIFNAFDCTCTYEVSDTCGVVFDENNVAGAVCPCCGSKYELMNCGMPTSGKARYSLKSYRVSYADPYLIIRN